jgi:hypothetical protein
VAISDRLHEGDATHVTSDMYQRPSHRVQVILNDMDEGQLESDTVLGHVFWEEVNMPRSADLLLGVSGPGLALGLSGRGGCLWPMSLGGPKIFS